MPARDASQMHKTKSSDTPDMEVDQTHVLDLMMYYSLYYFLCFFVFFFLSLNSVAIHLRPPTLYIFLSLWHSSSYDFFYVHVRSFVRFVLRYVGSFPFVRSYFFGID